MRKAKAIYSGLATQRSQPPSLVFGRDSKAERGVGGLYGSKREGSWKGAGVPCLEVVGKGKVKEKQSILCDWLRCTSGFLWLVLSWERRQKREKLSIIN